MKICFEGFEHSITVRRGRPFVLEVHNRALFARVCDSLVSCSGEDGFEAYTVWDDEKELRPKSAFLVVSDALNLPWECRELGGNLYQILQDRQMEDEELRGTFEISFRELNKLMFQLVNQLDGEYRFKIEWDLQRYLKAFGFAADYGRDDPFIDKLILFLDYCADMHVKKTLLFVNLKTFLTKNDVQKLYERVFFHDLKMLLVENAEDGNRYEIEDKLVIDQHFLEE